MVLNIYTEAYFENHQEKGLLFVLKDPDTGKIKAAAVLLEEDACWGDTAERPAYYVHNLVTACDVRGAGKQMLKELEKLAASSGKDYIRLDSTLGHDFLNQYYESCGYKAVGECVDGLYHGVLRQKKAM